VKRFNEPCEKIVPKEPLSSSGERGWEEVGAAEEPMPNMR
jgi:hypothetical protein